MRRNFRTVLLVMFAASALLITASEASAASKRPDLRVVSLSTQAAEVVQGGGLTATVKTRNARKKARVSQTAFFLSLDGKRDGRDRLLAGTQAVPALKPRRGRRAHVRLTLPADVPAGSYALLGCADAAGKVREANERNNCRAATQRVNVLVPGIASTTEERGGGAVTEPTTPPTTTPPPPPEPAAPAAPGPPTAAAMSTTRIDLAWQAVAGAAGYKVLRSAAPGGPYTEVAAPTATSFSDTGLAADTPYYYVVRAVNDAGESPNSPEASARTRPNAPSTAPANVQAVTSGPDQITVSWDAVEGATGYKVFRTTSPLGLAAHPAALPSGTSFVDGGRAPNTTYYYWVRATNISGDGPGSAQVSTTTAPAAPQNLQATSVSSSQLNLAWGAVSGATGYKVLRAADPAGPFTEAGSPTGTTFSDTGRAAATTYHYKVRAVGAGGESHDSAGASATTRPNAPDWLKATAVSQTEIEVDVDPVPGADTYRVLRAGSSNGTYVQIGTLYTTEPYIVDLADTGLSPDTTYYYKVEAIGAGGPSELSESVSAKTWFNCSPTGEPPYYTAAYLGSIRGDVGSDVLTSSDSLCGGGNAIWKRFELREADLLEKDLKVFINATVQSGDEGDIWMCLHTSSGTEIKCGRFSGSLSYTRYDDLTTDETATFYLKVIQGGYPPSTRPVRFTLTIDGN